MKPDARALCMGRLYVEILAQGRARPRSGTQQAPRRLQVTPSVAHGSATEGYEKEDS